ncbi:DNA-methyltransferase [Nonomuraea insulae]|uniref:Methyltransferase n=1 Tax=Nonomuraea insulae TaxID=1616787 RepID=A0ABW1D1Q0_9ACTN
MRQPYWSDEQAEIFQGDAREVLAEMEGGSIDCIVTSPPYYGLRHYCPGEYGQESTPAEYVENLQGVFAEARRVLADDGTFWLNLGDCYAANSDGWARGENFNEHQPRVRPAGRRSLPPKNLRGMPWQVALALQQDGWILRNAIVWHKPNAMPQSVLDRLSNRYEFIFLLVKQRHYWFNLDPIRERPAEGDRRPQRDGTRPTSVGYARPSGGKYGTGAKVFSGRRHGDAMLPTGGRHDAAHPDGKNPGDVWSICTRPLREAHFAAFPIDLPLRAIAAGCRPGGTVLDPFSGAGTSGIAARQLGRYFRGIELNAAYCELACARLAATQQGDSPEADGG